MFLPFVLALTSFTVVSGFQVSVDLGNLSLAVSFDDQKIYQQNLALSESLQQELGFLETFIPEVHKDSLDHSSSKVHAEFVARLAKGSVSSSPHLEAGSDAFTCQSLPQQYTPYLFCSGVVDYPFFVAKGLTVAGLDKSARQIANYYPSSILSTPCLSAIKRNICSAVFLPCSPNVVVGEVSSYMPVEYGYSLPYLRPCKSVCTSMDFTCAGILEAIGLKPPCDLLKDPYSGLAFYDATGIALSSPSSSSAITKCNDLPSTINKQLVASPAEPYIGKVCEGITKEFYVPAPSTVDVKLAPLLPPFVIQTMTEIGLTALEKLIPQYFTETCLLARREMMCSIFFLAPYANTALKKYFGAITLPSFPDKNICTNYLEQCSFMISSAPVLNMNCSATTGSFQLFPSKPQVISKVNLGFAVVPLVSPPFELKNVSASITPQCPYGWKMTPPLSSSSKKLRGTSPISGTACSMGCPVAVYTVSEYDWMFEQTMVSIWVSLAFTIVQVIHLAVLKPQKQNIFLVCFIVSSFLYNIFRLVQIFAQKEREAIICENAHQSYSITDYYDNHYKYENKTAYDLCAVSAVANLYLNYFYWWILFALSAEIWCRVVWGMKKVDVARRVYMIGSAVVLFGLALFMTFFDSPDINAIGSSGFFCGWTSTNKDTRFYGNTLPGIIIFTLSFAMSGHSIFVCLKTSLSVQDADRKPMMKIWKSYSMLILFLLLEIVVNPISIFYFNLYLGYLKSEAWIDGVTVWAQCLFVNFISSDSSEYLDVCGDHPSQRIAVVQFIVPFLVTTYLNAIVLFVITLNKEVKSFWKTLFIRLLTVMRVRVALEKAGLLSKQTMDKYFDASRESNILNNKNFRRQRQNSFSQMTTAVGNKKDLTDDLSSSNLQGLLPALRNSLVIHVRNLLGKKEAVAVQPENNDDAHNVKKMEEGELDKKIADSVVSKPKQDEDSDDDDDDETVNNSPQLTPHRDEENNDAEQGHNPQSSSKKMKMALGEAIYESILVAVGASSSSSSKKKNHDHENAVISLVPVQVQIQPNPNNASPDSAAVANDMELFTVGSLEDS